MTTRFTKEWPWARREKLAKEVDSKIPYRYRGDLSKTRSFQDEAKKLLPKLVKEIAEHNKKLERENKLIVDSHNTKRSTYLRTVRFGTEEEVSRIAAEILK